jgi:hypothetical protein
MGQLQSVLTTAQIALNAICSMVTLPRHVSLCNLAISRLSSLASTVPANDNPNLNLARSIVSACDIALVHNDNVGGLAMDLEPGLGPFVVPRSNLTVYNGVCESIETVREFARARA